ALKQSIPASAAVGIQDERTQRISEVIRNTMRKEDIPGVSVAVIDGGEIVWAQGFGWRDVDKRLAVDTDTQFQAASISKPVTALTVLKLKEASQLDLDKDVNGYFKDWRLNSKWPEKPVTLRLLLCHRAGMVPHGFLGYGESKAPPTLLEILNKRNAPADWLTGNYLGSVKVKYPPGAEFRYSGGGYCVAQKVVEDVTGEPFDAAMNKTLLEPLQMSRSHFHQPPLEQETDNAARGYGLVKTIVHGGRWGVYPQKAAAGLWTTPQDLARLIVAVQKAKAGQAAGPISPAIAEEFLKPQFDGWMGMGVLLDGEGDNRGFFHAGGNLGYVSRFGAGVSNGRGWVIMTNAEKDRFNPILKAIATEFGWL
ncbi:MAG: serine hydrolase domain-containing protein, partial [Solirubrobacterales bacterium]